MARKFTEPFPGFPDFRANVTFSPIQFFTVVVPHSSRGTVRIVGYALRKILGWVDQNGNPTRDQLRFTYRELIENAGVSRESIPDALREAIDRNFLRCVLPPNPDNAGRRAQSGVYELCWDEAGRYTDNPQEFRGFYYPEAAVVEVQDGSRTVQRPKSARKNIPNAFFDYLLPSERLSVIRVVGALLFYSIQWGPGGERKAPVTKSITELSRLTKLSRQHVHEAVSEACQRGYIAQADAGLFDPKAGKQSRAATYAIRWTQGDGTAAVRKGERASERSENVNGLPVKKSERNQSEIVNGDRSEKVNGLSIKNELKTEQSTTADAAADSGFSLLTNVGFDEKAAKYLSKHHGTEIIQRQINWLPLRRVTQSRLGLLRRAIEGDWGNPELDEVNQSGSTQARQFASNYYAGYHAFEGDAGTEPFPKDLEIAAKFVSRLLIHEPDEAMIPQWGRRFGRFIREKHHGDAKAKPNLSFALVLYGDEFLRTLRLESTARRHKAFDTAKQAHQRKFAAAYIGYLGQRESAMQDANASVYETFVQHREKLRQLLTGGPFLVSAERLARLENKKSRLLDFAAFFKDHPKESVLSFWQWDAQMNPQRFSEAFQAQAQQEAHG